jgi:hypothetical protein
MPSSEKNPFATATWNGVFELLLLEYENRTFAACAAEAMLPSSKPQISSTVTVTVVFISQPGISKPAILNGETAPA